MICWLPKEPDVLSSNVPRLILVLELETSRARLQMEKEQLQGEVREIERRKGITAFSRGQS